MTGKLSTFNKITLSVIFLGSLTLLIGVLKSERGLRNREQRLVALTGLLGLSYGGLELYWYFYAGFLQSRAIATAYYFVWHLLGGASLTMLFFIASPKIIKIALGVSSISFVAFNLFVISHYIPGHLAWIRLFSVGNALFIGVSITSAILLWLDLDAGKRSDQNGNGKTAMPETTFGNGRES